MHDLAPKARLILDAARDADEPNALDRSRADARMAARIGAGALVATSSVTAVAATSAALEATSIATGSLGLAAAKIALVVVAFAGVGSAVVYRTRALHHEDHRAIIVVATPIPIVRADAPLRITATPNEFPSSEPAVHTTAIAQVRPAHQPQPVHVSANPNSLREEMELLTSAQSALSAHDASRALDLLDSLALRFPTGVMRDARRIQRVRALCALNRVSEARREADRLRQENADSPLADAISGSCAAEEH